MTLTIMQISPFKKLAYWSLSQYSKLPWRQNRTIYTTLVSEIMLQQTTVGTVLNRYNDFFVMYPDLESLAQTSESELRKAWQGLGYYRRAANLFKAAKHIVEFGFSEDEEELKAIPGIGPYTASALIAIGHDLPALAVDGNLKRVISRLFRLSTPYEKGLDQEIRNMSKKEFARILKEIGPRVFNEALMDLGRSICRVRKPLCQECPLSKICQASQVGDAVSFPVRLKKKTKLHSLALLRFICLHKNQILLYKKCKGEWLEDQWELPTAMIKGDESLTQYPKLTIEIPLHECLRTNITKYKIDNYSESRKKTELLNDLPFYKKRELAYFSLQDLPHTSTASLKILKKLGHEFS
ncbi:MAG: A/G-specific adenine glycosylase [Planctomycetes bacterium]|nr:A/G-specific adenine glycosylase [Planctomycetota bacterium]